MYECVSRFACDFLFFVFEECKITCSSAFCYLSSGACNNLLDENLGGIIPEVYLA